jgi:hypothetical protein
LSRILRFPTTAPDDSPRAAIRLEKVYRLAERLTTRLRIYLQGIDPERKGELVAGWLTYELRIRGPSFSEPLWLLGATGQPDGADFFRTDTSTGILASAAAVAERRCARLSNLLVEPVG